jgi:hypothetical protein
MEPLDWDSHRFMELSLFIGRLNEWIFVADQKERTDKEQGTLVGLWSW